MRTKRWSARSGGVEVELVVVAEVGAELVSVEAQVDERGVGLVARLGGVGVGGEFGRVAGDQVVLRRRGNALKRHPLSPRRQQALATVSRQKERALPGGEVEGLGDL